MLFFSEDLDRTMVSHEFRYNIVPFSEIRRFWIYREQIGMTSFIINIFGNVVFFIPIGFLMPTLSFRSFFRKPLAVLLTCALVSLVLELLQLITKVGAFDVDDIILNTAGAVLGYLLHCLVRRSLKKRKDK